MIKCIIFFLYITMPVDMTTTKNIIRLVQPEAVTTTKPSYVNNTSKFVADINSGSMKFLSLKGHVNGISQFSLAYNFSPETFDCHCKYLPIDFTLRHTDGTDKILQAFLDPIDSALHHTQEFSKNCRNIWRYKIDDQYTIIIVKDQIKLVNNKNADSSVQKELLRDFDFYRYLLIILNLYEEETDGTLYYEGLKLLTFTATITYLIYWFTKFTLDWLKCLKEIIQEYKEKGKKNYKKIEKCDEFENEEKDDTNANKIEIEKIKNRLSARLRKVQ